MLRDLHNSITVGQSVAPILATGTTDLEGTGFDLSGYNAAEIVFEFGISADTLSGSLYVDGIVQESDDDVTYTDVAAADLLGTEPRVDAAAEDPAVHSVGYIGNKRYVRAKFDLVGTHTSGIELAATVIRAFPRHGNGEVV